MNNQKRALKQSRPLPDSGNAQQKPKHRESFMLMIYRSDDGEHVETLWNSRDGVTPFIIGVRGAEPGVPGANLQHVHWGADTFAPYHVPNVGDRIFVDLTVELAQPMVEAQIERWWESPQYPMRETFKNKDEAREKLLEECMKEGAPAIVTVDAGLQRMFYERIAEHDQRMLALSRTGNSGKFSPSGQDEGGGVA